MLTRHSLIVTGKHAVGRFHRDVARVHDSLGGAMGSRPSRERIMKARLKPADGALLCLEPPTQVGGKQKNCRLKPARESADFVMDPCSSDGC